MKSNGKYDWKFSTIGGVTRVNIENGQDIAHLGELDQKMWTALRCPTKGLAIDQNGEYPHFGCPPPLFLVLVCPIDIVVELHTIL